MPHRVFSPLLCQLSYPAVIRGKNDHLRPRFFEPELKKPKLAVLPYKHHPKYKFVLDLRAFGRGRKFFKTRVAAEAEQMRQKTALERHGREAIGLPQHELSDFIRTRKELAGYGKTIAAGLTIWPKNGPRHSYASYRLAATSNAPAVASELGHSTPAMLYAHYRELVLPEEAERYWKIEPSIDAENLVAFRPASF